jgi:hypothetical protein
MMGFRVRDLRTAIAMLRRARMFIEPVRSLFRGDDPDAAARVAEIGERIDAEIDYIERLQTKAQN